MKPIIEYADGPTGRLTYAVFCNGKIIESVDEPNLIVNVSKRIHSRLLGGSTGYAITHIGFGTNGTTPAAGNTALTNAYIKPVGTITYPATNKVQFAFTLNSDEANGKAILEMGLLTALSGGRLYARRVRLAALNKTSALTLSGSWTITF